ncbi:hypothetical protein BDA99DRAFT_604308 [Phascolomyces articulosus]|uniref:Uncharacterized protein n=1 Tax=Phascolomyces articulosus TaxID=60185 RepID=A0AAD5K1P2_9FUNG|nr:hypothetical protein BDA99DRAFT_604308 [Phascolomyces articulosus]
MDKLLLCPMKSTFALFLVVLLGLVAYTQAICNCQPKESCQLACGNGSTCQNKADVCRSTGCEPGWDYMCWSS